MYRKYFDVTDTNQFLSALISGYITSDGFRRIFSFEITAILVNFKYSFTQLVRYSESYVVIIKISKFKVRWNLMFNLNLATTSKPFICFNFDRNSDIRLMLVNNLRNRQAILWLDVLGFSQPCLVPLFPRNC